MTDVIAGRDVELTSLRDFVAALPGGAVACVLEGDAGMGKTTLWRATVQHAQDAHLLVLQAQPVESETTLSFTGIGDLLDAVLDAALEPLPPIQQRALTRALALGDDDDAPLEPRVLRVALLNALRALAAEQPVLIAIDDSQWLDYASAAALAYGVRRFGGEPIGLLLSRRLGLESALLQELLRSPVRERFTRIDVTPLDVGTLGRVLQDQLGAILPRPLLAEVHEASAGNPFYALEIVRMLQRSDAAIEAGQPIRVPDSLYDLVHGRLLALPPQSRDFLLAAAAHAHPTISITEEASGISRVVGLQPALDARIVELDHARIRFTHPLLAAGALETSDPQRRAEIHARLAELLEDPEARAWQLAASVDEPDETVAAALEAASSHARTRGAPRPAALLLDRAAALTPKDRPEDRIRREVDAAYLHFESGDSHRAEAQLRELIAPMGAGPARARPLVVLARIRLYEVPAEARSLFLQVLDEADDPYTRAVAHEGVAASTVWRFEGFRDVIEHTDLALSLAAQLGDEALQADILLSRITAETLLDLPTLPETSERALALQQSAEGLRVMDQPLISFAENWLWVDEHEQARRALDGLMRHARESGDENGQPWLLCLLGELERLAGELERALELAHEAQDAAQQSGQPLFRAAASALESIVQAQLGRPAETAAAGGRAQGASRDRFVELVVAAALGHLALSQGRPQEAVEELAPAIDLVREEGIVEPGAMRLVVDRVEALVELARTEEALELLEWYEGNARRLERASALANCARCRGLLAAQAGDLDAALAAYAEALEWHAQVELPLDRGRTLLALGAAQRRLKRRREARETLEQALAVFEHIGAALWAERARAELKRISGRAATPGALTPAEERVAALVAEGKTNKEVAAALFLSDRTIEGHLARIFGKLDIRHRAELAGALQTRGIGVSNTGDSPVSAELPAP